jgi:glutamate-1-semialdehyde 2,1-aminomutase
MEDHMTQSRANMAKTPPAADTLPYSTRSEEMWQEARKHAPMGAQGEGKYYAPYPLFIDRAQGSRLWDVDGNEYIDYWNGAGPCVLGHAHPDVNHAVAATLDERGVLFCAPHQREMQLAKRISEVVPSAEMSAFGCGGSDAVCYAVRTSRLYTQRTKILKFEGSYHGWYDGVLFSITPDLAAAGSDDAPVAVAESLGLPPEAASHITILQYNDEEAVEKLFAAHGQEYACVIVEPVLHGAGVGVLEPKPSFLPFLRDICTRYGVVLVFDEILTGFRHDIGGAQRLMNVSPDLTAFGKAMSNGFPICALSGKREFMSHMSPQGRAYFSGTYNGNIMCAVAALKTIELLSDGSAHRKLWALGKRFADGVNESAQRIGIKVRARHYGSMVTVHFTDRELFNYRDVVRNHDKAKNRAFVDWVNDHGLYTKPRRVNRFAISTAHSEDDIDRSVAIIERFFVQHKASFA